MYLRDGGPQYSYKELERVSQESETYPEDDEGRDEEVLLQGMKELITSNTESIKTLFHYNTKKRESSPSNDSSLPPSRTAKLTKPAKVPSWTKDMSLKTYVKQLTTWQEIN